MLIRRQKHQKSCTLGSKKRTEKTVSSIKCLKAIKNVFDINRKFALETKVLQISPVLLAISSLKEIKKNF